MALNTKDCSVRKSILFSSNKISGKMKSRALTKRSKCKYYTKKGRKKWKKVQRFMRFNELQFLLNPMIPTWDCVSLRVHRASQKIPRKDPQKEMNEEFELITVKISLAATGKRKQLSNCHRQTNFQCSHAKHVTSRNSAPIRPATCLRLKSLWR